MQPILQLIRKEFKQVFRTREMIAILFFVPIIQMMILGFAITNEVKDVKLLIADLDHSPTSRALIEEMLHTDSFKPMGEMRGYEEIDQAIESWKAQLGILIPPDFEADLLAGRKPRIAVVIDGIDGNTAGVAGGYLRDILTDWGMEYSTRYIMRQGIEGMKRFKAPVGFESGMWFNENLEASQFMVPGIVVIMITLVSMMMSAMGLVREKEIGTLEQLMVTPIKKWQLLIGKLLPFLVLTFFELFLSLFISQLIFGIHVQGSYFLLAGLALLFLFTTLGLGVLISTMTSSQQQAMFFSWFFLVFMILLSGLFIPIKNMPWIIKQITWLNPMKYFIVIMREITAKGATLPFLLDEVIPMTVYGIVIFSLSIVSFRKRVG